MDRRQALTTIGLGATGYVATAAFTAPACGVSKEKAVRVTGFIISLSKEAIPLLNLLGAQTIADLVTTRVVPALEKLKDVLDDVDIPAAESALATVRGVLSSVATALLNLPDTPRRTTIMGILASVNVLLLTVEAFVESETVSPAPPIGAAPTMRKSPAASIRRVFEASR